RGRITALRISPRPSSSGRKPWLCSAKARAASASTSFPSWPIQCHHACFRSASTQMDRAEKRPSTAFATVDYDRQGKQVGFIMIPHSPNDDAWGATRIPVAVIANGKGPTVIIEGGNHGDEYEGPIAITELVRDLDPGRIQGRLILLPSINAPAAMGGQRVSPVDGLNVNRVFPGDPYGSITEQIAAYLMDELFPIGDAFLDLHSGGSSLDLLPSAIVEPSPDPTLRRKNIDAEKAFDAPLTVVIDNMGDPR